MMPYQQLRFAPGSRYAYSNPGYIHLGRIVELIAGDRYDMGLGFMLGRDRVDLDVEHTGDQAGYKSFLRFRPARRTAHVMVFNTAGREAPQLLDALRKAAAELLGE